MLNKKNQRELAYLATVTNVIKHPNADRLDIVYINGWTVITGRDEFSIGQVGVFFEPDSLLPDVAPFNENEFLKSKNFKIKEQKIRGSISQGLFMPVSAFGWVLGEKDGNPIVLTDKDTLLVDDESRFLTNKLNVTYYMLEDNARKSDSSNKYKSMQDRHKKLFRSKFGKWIMKREWGRKIMFFIFGKKKDKKSDFPSWVKKTDEERIQNLPFLFPKCDTEWIVTEKIDGTSTTFTMRNDRKRKLIVCSRNVVFDAPEKENKNFYKDSDGNVYLEMAKKYNMEKVLNDMLNIYSNISPVPTIEAPNEWGKLEYITIQGETYGGNIQKRNYGNEHRLAVFNIIFGYKNYQFRLNPISGERVAESFGLSYVPVLESKVILPETCDEVIAMAHGNSMIDGGMREGLVFRSMDGSQSFKAVDPEFLIRYHG